MEEKDLENMVLQTDDKVSDKVNWSNVWSKKYPVLSTYKDVVDVDKYKKELRNILEELKKDYNYTELDAVLVLKDILYHEMKR